MSKAKQLASITAVGASAMVLAGGRPTRASSIPAYWIQPSGSPTTRSQALATTLPADSFSIRSRTGQVLIFRPGASPAGGAIPARSEPWDTRAPAPLFLGPMCAQPARNLGRQPSLSTASLLGAGSGMPPTPTQLPIAPSPIRTKFSSSVSRGTQAWNMVGSS